ncbi:glutaredoxin family protein [Bifidobacterium sp.]|jgi:glutaredoxin-like protein NrdH|uniref:glutaredoxin family protein n=1 Tax=Bifidobacterium sp. TaxID=41200 RepID=UPI0025BE48C9|nr:glutaredoxin family protein [Bifidobacterium sp.]MCH4160939.1 glutaredoxin family protein [Bifidobacterium sp.]MCI1635104.1 glutaredoxin family protein [Bifidobacterium sp.]
MSITVFAKPHCPQCDATKRQFNKLGVEYDIVDLTQDAAALEEFRAAGYRQAPVVVAGEDTWTGFRPDMINKVAEFINA